MQLTNREAELQSDVSRGFPFISLTWPRYSIVHPHAGRGFIHLSEFIELTSSKHEMVGQESFPLRPPGGRQSNCKGLANTFVGTDSIKQNNLCSAP